MSDSMVYHNSYLNWLFESIISNFYYSVNIFKQTLKLALRRGNLEFADIAISGAFVRGKWVGIARILSMEVQERQALLGCAKFPDAKN